MAISKKKTHKPATSKKMKSKSMMSRNIAVIIALFLLTFSAAHITWITPISADQTSSVLGDDDENEEEDNEDSHDDEDSNDDSDDDEDEQEDEHEQENEQEDEDENEQERENEQEQRQETRRDNSGSNNQRFTAPIRTGAPAPQIKREFKQEIRSNQNSFEYESEEEVENESDDDSSEVGQERKMDFRLSNGMRIRTEVDEEGKAKLEYRGATYRYKYEIENGKIKIKIKTEAGEDADISDDEVGEIENSVEDDLAENGVELEDSTDDTSSFKSRGVRTRTHFPLSIDPVTHMLTVETPNGVKSVAVLPDEAVENLIAKGVLDVVPTDTDETSTEDESELVERNGEAVYKVNGTRHMKFFGIIPVDVPVTAYVSAEDGTPTEEELSFLSRMIDFLSL